MIFNLVLAAVIVAGMLVLVLTKNFKRRVLEPFFLWLAFAGILCLFQPFSMAVFGKGFAVLLAGFIGYNVASHVK
jgi:hypothetical protein